MFQNVLTRIAPARANARKAQALMDALNPLIAQSRLAKTTSNAKIKLTNQAQTTAEAQIKNPAIR